MKIYGYESDDSDLVSLSEVTLQLSLKELNDFIEFLNNTAKLMEAHGDKFGHEHLNDFYKKDSKPDIIIIGQ
ncbi:conserved protein of unknown function [Xenorhabdus poinarii G6]|uniref:Uncharacterized protein n=1 Tax=Xenorhabdus poinarii G6 TaxID=1354304 RepID=A0A068R530_9GAMM|nr:hypothetical protein [Xenorhabdus poinarii]CDG22283.1 conserved protein of unknown function [Xenorhabdus poinarii G6]